jgi:RNA polymerase sigma factor for flagellar operon FliA
MTQPPPLQDAERDKLVQEHLGYVRSIAAKVKKELNSPTLDFDELVAYGSRGLVEAAHRFDPTRGVAFTTFSYYRIRGAIFDGLREIGWLGRSQYARFAAGANAYLGNQAERPATGHGKSTEQRVTEVAEALQDLTTIFLTAMEGPDEPVDVVTPDGVAAVEAKQTGEAIRAAVAELPEKERTLVELFYFQGMSLQDAGKTIGLSKSWASRLHSRAIQLLAKKLLQYRPDP